MQKEDISCCAVKLYFVYFDTRENVGIFLQQRKQLLKCLPKMSTELLHYTYLITIISKTLQFVLQENHNTSEV